MSIKLMAMIWEDGPSDRTELLVLLALADFANDNGKCWPAIETIAKKARLSDRGAQKVIARLSAAGWVSVDVGGGRHGCNVYHIRTGNPEPDSESTGAKTPNRVHPEPCSPRTGVQETPNGGSPEPSRTTKESNNADVLDVEFDVFWEACPRRVAKANAKKAYVAARKIADADVILSGIRRHAAEVQGRDPKYIPHPTTWLRGERWADEVSPQLARSFERDRGANAKQQPRSQVDVIAERLGIETSNRNGAAP